MKDGFLKVACATPVIRVADCFHNAERITELAREAAQKGVSLIVFPELCITGYTCGDLFGQTLLLDQALEALFSILEATKELDLVMAVGLPLACGSALYNTAAVLSRGKLLGLVPKKNIPNYSEFYEARHFTGWQGGTETLILRGEAVPFGEMLFACEEMPAFCLGVEICEDLWVPAPPSVELALAGATVLANLSASDEVVGKAAYRRELVKGQSARLMAAYLYADAGQGESSTDMVFAGHDLIAENGALLAESELFAPGLLCADVDLSRMESERRRANTFPAAKGQLLRVGFHLPLRETVLSRKFPPAPFVPADPSTLSARSREILAMQTQGLVTRLRHTRAKTAVVGLSGGLDSTLALIVTVHAFDALGLDRKGVLAVTMPCFGTTKRTRSNAELLAESYGVSFKEVVIKKAVLQHFEDIGQDPETLDVTFENAQARERTQVLMDLANQRGGLVIGTGDLSELALGWATYNGDHMSMYGVNASIPKTLVRHLTAYEASRSPEPLASVLRDVLATPVSPELLPPKDGEIAQKTEDLVGPYELHDFFLYYFLRCGFRPEKIFRIAKLAFEGFYEPAVIKQWLCTFLRRFFAQQFKRSCLPDGPKVGTVTLSPRGDWRMPSDACAALWLAETEGLPV